MSLRHYALGCCIEAMADTHGAMSLKARINWPENQGLQVRYTIVTVFSFQFGELVLFVHKILGSAVLDFTEPKPTTTNCLAILAS